MDFETKQLDYNFNRNGDIQLTFTIDKQHKSNIEPLNELFADDSIKVLKIDKKRKKRSLNANNYAWKLITEIANALRSSKEEVYFQMLKNYGQMVTVSIEEKAVDTFLRTEVAKYSEIFAEGTVNGKLFKHIHVWIGSSQYNTQEMSIFIDGIVSECTDLKICTMTPQELEELKSKWVTK